MGYPHARIVDSPTASFYHCIITYTQHAMERVSTPPLTFLLRVCVRASSSPRLLFLESSGKAPI